MKSSNPLEEYLNQLYKTYPKEFFDQEFKMNSFSEINELITSFDSIQNHTQCHLTSIKNHRKNVKEALKCIENEEIDKRISIL